MLLHLRLVLHLALIFITFAVGITFAVVITFSGDTHGGSISRLFCASTGNHCVVLLQGVQSCISGANQCRRCMGKIIRCSR